MAKGPHKEAFIACDCPECNGAKIDQCALLRHQGGQPMTVDEAIEWRESVKNEDGTPYPVHNFSAIDALIAEVRRLEKRHKRLCNEGAEAWIRRMESEVAKASAEVRRLRNQWVSVEEGLPEIPEGKYGLSVLVVTFDSVYEEISPGHGQSVSMAHFGTTIDRHGNRLPMFEGTTKDHDFMEMYFYEELTWGPTGDPVTHWQYKPEAPHG